MREFFLEYPVAGGEGRKDEGLKEPSHVRQMPLWRTRVFHRLNAIVFNLQRRAQGLGAGAHRLKTLR